MGVSEKFAASSGQIRSRIGSFTEKLAARVLSWKLHENESDGLVTYFEWVNLVFPRLPCDEHRPEKGNLVGQKPPDAVLSWRS